MILLSVSNLYKSYGVNPILTGASLTVQTGERVGLVGPNGAGKTTFLKTILGELPADQGEIHFAKNTSVGYLSQHGALQSSRTLYEEMREVFTDIYQLEVRMRNLETQMSEPDIYEDSKRLDAVSAEYSRVSEEFAARGGYAVETRIRSVLHGLDFPEPMHSREITTLSGGQKTRLALGKLLLQEPDLLILDEPTNYLDIQTMTWLEGYLKGYPGALLLVSHDRYFLDALVSVVYELELGQTSRYTGNYTDFIEQKADKMAQQAKRYEQQQEEIERMEDFIRRNIVRATTTKRAQSRRKMLEKMDRIAKPDTALRASHFSFDIRQTSGHLVLQVDKASIQYESADFPLFENLTFSVYRQDRVALLGPNGAGKSSLLKGLLGQIPFQEGSVRFGTNVSIGYYTQEQEDLQLDKTVLQEVWDAFPKLDQTRVRTVLGNFLFVGDAVTKPIHSLSGGERARVALAKLMLQEANFLLLDEPTNHLDLISKEVLEAALDDYPGTILFISHDRYFLNRIATRVLELGKQGVADYAGNYDDYLDKKARLVAEGYLQADGAGKPSPADDAGQAAGSAAAEREAKRQQERILKRERKKREERIAFLENKIQESEQTIAEIEQTLCDPAVFQDVERSRQLTAAYEQEKNSLADYYEEWESLLADDESDL